MNPDEDLYFNPNRKNLRNKGDPIASLGHSYFLHNNEGYLGY